MIEIPESMEVGRPTVIDDFQGVLIRSQEFNNPIPEFVDAIRGCILNKVKCSFMPQVPETVEVTEMSESLDRGGAHTLWVVYRSPT